MAKRRAHTIQHCRGEKRGAKLYRALIAATDATVAAKRCKTWPIAWRSLSLDNGVGSYEGRTPHGVNR